MPCPGKNGRNIGNRSYERRTNVSCSNTLGYAHPLFGQSGIEQSQNWFYVLVRHSGKIAFGTKRSTTTANGLDLKLNINLAMRKRLTIYLQIGRRGLNNECQRRRGLRSLSPSLRYQSLEETWQSLLKRSDAPLLNRATQASYPIGSLATTLAFESVWSNQNAVQVLNPGVLTRYDSACYETIKANELALDGVQAGCMSAAIDHLTASDPKLLLKNLSDFGIFSVPDLVIQCGQPPLAPELDQLDRNPELLHNCSQPRLWHWWQLRSPTTNPAPTWLGQRIS